MKLLTAKQKSYLAGILDGEGCLRFHHSTSRSWLKDGRRKEVSYISPSVKVTNTNMQLHTWLMETTGIGEVIPVPQKVKGRKQASDWRLHTDEITPFLTAVFDDLIVKREQASILLAFLARPWGYPLTEADLDLRGIMHRRMLKLNRRGSVSVHAELESDLEKIERSEFRASLQGTGMRQLTATQAAYSAALTDGEGYIGMVKFKEKGVTYHYPRVSVANTDMRMLEWLLKTTGVGRISSEAKTPDGSKSGFSWYLRIDEMAPFLSAIQDDLVIKWNQAYIVLEYLATEWHQPLTDAEVDLREIMFDELECMNKKGT